MSYGSEEIHILRDRMREYKELLDVAYHFIESAALNKDDREKAEKILSSLDQHGIGDTTPQPIVRRDFDGAI
jgi:hypothetical protein